LESLLVNWFTHHSWDICWLLWINLQNSKSCLILCIILYIR
jgi:hypothetical protein